MATDSIGKPCECIFRFEKHYILLALENLIEKSKAKLEETKTALAEASEEEKKSFMYQSLKESGEAIHKRFIDEVSVVKERVTGMKTCD